MDDETVDGALEAPEAPSDPVLLGVIEPRALIRARATITTGGMQAGDLVQADPDSPFVQLCLEHGWLIREPA